MGNDKANRMLDVEFLDETAKKSFYPTPDALAEKMVLEALKVLPKGQRCGSNYTILEPSAGGGMLIRMIGKCFGGYSPGHESSIRFFELTNGDSNDMDTEKLLACAPRKPKIDFIEIDENLRTITKGLYSSEKKSELKAQMQRYERQYSREIGEYVYAEGHEELYNKYYSEWKILDNLGPVRCVGDDFMSYHTYKVYDLIFMNPPFSEGAEHLLKALEMQSRTGGSVVCILNAETLRNPCTLARKELAKKLRQVNANIQYIKEAFAEADRKTMVEVALISCHIESPAKFSNIFEGLQKAKEEEVKSKATGYVKTVKESFTDDMIEQYDFEVQMTLKLVEEYEAIKPYIAYDFPYIKKEALSTAPIVKLSIAGGEDFSINEYLKEVRLKYWRALFHNPQFTGMLTSNLATEFHGMVEDMQHYDFNEFNVNQIKKRMAAKMEEGYYDTILNLFDKLSCVHSYTGLPEEDNVWMYNGWKTNKAWKVNDKKVIIPCYGAFSAWSGKFCSYTAYELLSDIEKTLNYLDCGRTEDSHLSLKQIISTYSDAQSARNIDTKFFTVTFYKKGTCHITWKDAKLIEKLNIIGSKKKGWLPPGYGTKAYKDMSEEEKVVIDDFQGEKEYNKIMREHSFYLGSNVLQLAM